MGFDDEETVEYHLGQAYRQIGRDDLSREYMEKFEKASKAAHARQPQTIEEFQITPP